LVYSNIFIEISFFGFDKISGAMISISLTITTLILGAKTVFSNITWEIQHGQKIGFVGANDAGKSSSFKLILGEYSAEPGGRVSSVKDVNVHVCNQRC
jgi:ATPase subunit of ABC transporter with duplicated ATPase domains